MGVSHVAAILFKVESAVRNGYTAGTSSACRWNEVFSTKVQQNKGDWVVCYSSIIVCFYVSSIDQHLLLRSTFHNQRGMQKDCNTSAAKVPQESSTSRIPSPTFEEQEMFLKGLKAMQPNAAILTTVIPIPQKETDSHTPAIRTLPPTIMSLHHPHFTKKS